MKRRLEGWCEIASSLGVSRNIGSWKGAAIQRGFEHGSRGIAIVRSRYQEMFSEDTAGWKIFGVCSSDF
jgi:hypothetical protein